MTWVADKRIVITGASSGIGRYVAGRLAELGANIVLACRDRGSGEHVAAEINAGTGEERATVMTVDVADRRSVRAFAEDYRSAYGTLDVLVNNAGVLLPTRRTSVDGVELTFATNVLGYYLMTTALLDLLTASAPSRVVNVASTFAFAVDLDDLQFKDRPYDGMAAYAQSKACDRMLSWAFARRLEAAGVAVNAMAPGLILDTGLYDQLSAEAKNDLAQYGTRSLAEGAETAVWLASSGDVDGVTATFFEQRTAVVCEFHDRDTEERLWRECEQILEQLEPIS